MIVVLYVLICTQVTCQKLYVPTPYTFACNDPGIHEAYIAQWYPEWEYKAFRCENGRFA